MTRPDPANTPADDDPTHALDDFLRRMRPSSSTTTAAATDVGDPPDLPDLSGLTARVTRTVGAHSPKGGTLRNGERWQADDVTDVPVVELPCVAPAAAPADDLALNDIGQQASAAAARAAQAAAQASADWQPDPQALQLRPAHDPRVLARWQPGAWIGAQRVVLQASTEFVTPAGSAAGPVVESYDAQRLLVLWAPPSLAAPHPGRWPRQVLLAPVSAEAAAAALLAARPAADADAPLWLDPEASHVDWALAAEIALHHVPGLRPFQVEGLRAFIEAEREASFGRVNDGYGPASGGAVAKPA